MQYICLKLNFEISTSIVANIALHFMLFYHRSLLILFLKTQVKLSGCTWNPKCY